MRVKQQNIFFMHLVQLTKINRSNKVRCFFYISSPCSPLLDLTNKNIYNDGLNLKQKYTRLDCQLYVVNKSKKEFSFNRNKTKTKYKKNSCMDFLTNVICYRIQCANEDKTI